MGHNNINWKRMVFKKNKVWMAMDQNQNPVIENGKALIKYQLDQEYEYWILAKNIKPIDSLHLEEKSTKKKTAIRPCRASPRGNDQSIVKGKELKNTRRENIYG